MHRGSCLCGAVRFDIAAPLHAPDACHCSQCRKQSGHYWVSTDVLRGDLVIHGADKLTWYQSSSQVRRGFCSTCGSALLWDRAGRDRIGVAMGALESPTNTHLGMHIFVGDKGDYYDIADGVPQYLRWPESAQTP
ncbi:GFA family protein [Tahibacter amnicola]|uniref:GFA family protein n=1 Tax=Tahibacter amnicola TaxID=2976241 RepID=A0ABY6BAW3_9GAMM|nr:GFA family protein [Tahibacter amnicola]UXI67004.1 GFA family protein [Tahibacter amnicola]